MTFPQFLRQKRLLSGLSQEQVSQALGYNNRSQACRLEAGTLVLKLEHVFLLARLFGVTASELVAEFEGYIAEMEGERTMEPLRIDDVVVAVDMPSPDMLWWPYAGPNGVRVKPGQMGAVVRFTKYPELTAYEQYPIVRFDETDADVQIRLGQVKKYRD